MPSLMEGLAETISLPRKSKRLPVRLKSLGNSPPVAEQCCRIKYVGIVIKAVDTPAMTLAHPNLPAAFIRLRTENLFLTVLSFAGTASMM